MVQQKHLTYFDILSLCEQETCPVCQAGQKAVFGYLEMILYESVTDPGVNDTLCASWGYCYEHAWLLPKIGQGNLSGIALLYRELITCINKQIPAARETTRKRWHVLRWLRGFFPSRQQRWQFSPQQRCPACQLRQDTETRTLQVIIAALSQNDERMSHALQVSGGLCLTHLQDALAVVQHKGVIEHLIHCTQHELTHIHDELNEFIRKYDYRFHHESIGNERESWKRAIRFFVGIENV